MAKANSVALIAPVHSYRASVYLTAASKHGISVVFISDGRPAIVHGIIDGIRLSFSDITEAKHTISELLGAHGVQAVIAPDEKFVELAAEISIELGLPHNSLTALKTASDKHLSRKKLESAGIPGVPEFDLIELNGDLDKQISNISYPCVAKPLNLSASRGVIRANNRAELLEAFERIRKILSAEFEDPNPIRVLVETFVDGTEHALEGYLSDSELDVICLFDKPDPLNGPYFEETYYVTPSRLDESTQEAIKQAILTGCKALGLKMGPIHAEVRVSNGCIWILEIAARSIGGDCGRIFEYATQSSLEEFVICRAVGQQMETLKLEQAAGVLMIPVPENGILKRVEGVIDAQTVDDVLAVRLDAREGEKLVRWPEGSKYPGFIYSVANSPERAEAALRESYSHLNFVCMPDLPVLIE